MVGRAGGELVLARRRDRAVAAAAARDIPASAAPRMSSPLFLTIFSVAVAVGSGLAAWLAAGRIVLLPTLVGAVLLGLFSLDLGWTASAIVPRRASDRRSASILPRATASTSPSISPASPSPAGCSSCRPSPRCRPGPAPTAAPASSPPSTCSTPPSWSSARSSSRCCKSSAASVPTLFALIGVANLVVAVVIGLHHAGELDERSSLHRLPRLLPARGHGPGEHRQGRATTPSSRSTM